MIPKLTKAQKIGVGILIPTIILLLFFKDVYGTILGSLAGAGVGLLFWSKDPNSKQK